MDATADRPAPPTPPPAAPDTDGVDPAVHAVLMAHMRRRHGLLTALTKEFERLYAAADPTARTLCLYATPVGTWYVARPLACLPSPVPVPVLGINHCRDSMRRDDWAAWLAAHSDAWLAAHASFDAASASFGRAERAALFHGINAVPTLFRLARDWFRRLPERLRCRPGVGPAMYDDDHAAAYPLRARHVTRHLKGKAAFRYWRPDDRWWPVRIVAIAPRQMRCTVRYYPGTEEDLDLKRIVRNGHLRIKD